MAFELPALPYALNALEPYISQRTMEFHYGKHHKAYVDNLNRLIAGTPYENIRSVELWPNGFAWLLRDGAPAAGQEP